MTLEFYLEFNFNNFEKQKAGKITIACYNNLTIGTNIIEFYVNIISDLGFIIILYLFLLHNLLEGEY